MAARRAPLHLDRFVTGPTVQTAATDCTPKAECPKESLMKRPALRQFSVLLLTTGIASLIAACRGPMPYTYEPPARFSLEIVNDSAEPIWVEIELMSSDFLSPRETDGVPDQGVGTKALLALPAAPRNSCGPPSIGRSPILALDRDESVTLPIKTYTSPCGAGSPGNDETNVFVRQFRAIHFLGIAPVTSYEYWLTECIGFYCSHPGDDTLVVHESSDGTTHQLFLESSDRPFYLERDTDNPQLARVVITFVPTPVRVPGSSGPVD